MRAEAPFVSKRTVPSTESAVNLRPASPESVTVPDATSVPTNFCIAVPDIVATPIPVYAGVKSISGCVSSPDIVNVPDGIKSWKTDIFLVSATPLISVRTALAADGITIASAAEPSPKRVPDTTREFLTPVTTLMSLLSVRTPDPSNSHRRKAAVSPDSVSVAVFSGV